MMKQTGNDMIAFTRTTAVYSLAMTSHDHLYSVMYGAHISECHGYAIARA